MQQLLTGHQRLPGFTGEWEEKAIGEQIDASQPVCTFQSNQYWQRVAVRLHSRFKRQTRRD